MVLGLPTEDADKPTFYFDRNVTWADHDVEEQPWDWTSVPVSDTTATPVLPICAAEFFAPLGRSGAQFSEVGDMFPSTVVFTFMKQDFDTIFGASYATIGPTQTKWWFRYWKPVVGLDGFNVYQAHFQAEDTT